jgi:precorrin-8X/cobalt-precorrin-8 methylmutase
MIVSTTPCGAVDDVVRLSSKTTAFDAYLAIDWSASSAPKTGKDSVWWCLCRWCDNELTVETNENPATRRACFDAVRGRLGDLLAAGSSVLAGFDFPYGYPAGLAAALGLNDSPWRSVWDDLKACIADDQTLGTNNRFHVAGDLNRRIGAADGPFWGHPQRRPYPYLRATEPRYPVSGLPRLREVDRHARRVQPAWKLWGNVSVGSQTLLGIPMLAQLRDDEDLRRVSAVWPFETGCALPPRGEGPRIIFAEIYPSLVLLPKQLGDRVKDSAQVEAIGRHLARHDAAGTLCDLFSAPGGLDSSLRRRVESDEGWILGVMPDSAVSR